ncbi:MAG: T9SS type A sorting domain-containing protein [Crocinitomicaceae bacterium]
MPIVPTNTDDEPIEVYYLVSEQSSTNAPRKAVGVICNRTYNYFTQGDGLPCISNTNDPDLPYNVPTNYEYHDIDDLNLKIPNMGTTKDYYINWYDGLTGIPLDTSQDNSGLLENVELEFPGKLTGNASRPILFFEVYPQGSSFKSSQNTDTIIGEHTITDKQKFETSNLGEIETEVITISPNPTTSVINVKISNHQMSYLRWFITDVHGKNVRSGNIAEPNFTVDLSVLESGMYYLHIQNEEVRQSFKIIKQ